MKLWLTLIFLTTLWCVNAAAANLTVACDNGSFVDLKNPQGVVAHLQLRISNEAKTPKFLTVSSAFVDGHRIGKFKMDPDIQFFYYNGFHLKLKYGNSHKESLFIEAKNCKNSNLAEGRGVINRYLGGYIETSPSHLNCTCRWN